MMIKRYPNRKLYNTETGLYITLAGVANLIQEGKEVHVVDYASGEDVTTQVLSKVIAGEEKKQRGFIPRPVLAGLVQAGGATLEGLRRAMLLPLDILRLVDEEIQRRIDVLIKHGEVTEAEGLRLLDQLLAVSPRSLSDTIIEREIKKFLDQEDIPTRADLQQLTVQITQLTEKLDGLD